jgi:hypothetical protein
MRHWKREQGIFPTINREFPVDNREFPSDNRDFPADARGSESGAGPGLSRGSQSGSTCQTATLM